MSTTTFALDLLLFDIVGGHVSQETCHSSLRHEFSLDPVDIRKAAEDSCASLKWDTNLEIFFHELKDENRETMCIFAMFNVSHPGYEALQSVSADMNWSIFDGIFTFFVAGRRKPDFGFYRCTLSQANLDPSRTIFIDDEREHTLGALPGTAWNCVS
ncbi:uncharacterized protein BT62DRAFT_1079381 [Guyanagaster necrorhizus]|uniref:Uncharacterized protein n=1 Tax=Guyanagaster necrorhizus TaxID=856835 RepID=A0A9P7VLP7_9AGAR|nr:uncharacterized protein BT62DRAFT_1079381 [Guyanagaster necrorhizus MCA 3950]KAG7442256.1 hypothetical protein BT62DRAFT_1079381 [Guyanagaster necrorhizus MCA 3950]